MCPNALNVSLRLGKNVAHISFPQCEFASRITAAITGWRELTLISETAGLSHSVASHGYARHGRDCYGVQVPCTRLEPFE